jgi:hypothetical protein
MIVSWPRYRGLNKPDRRLPDSAFGVVRTVVSARSATSRLLARRAVGATGDRKRIIGRFTLSGFLKLLIG